MRLQISKHIYAALRSYEPIQSVIGDKVFPIATKNEVTFPFIVYERDAILPQYDKGGASVTDSTVSVYILSESYTQSLDIAEMVIDALERKDAVYDDFLVIGAILTAATESYTNSTYIQQLTFKFTTKNK